MSFDFDSVACFAGKGAYVILDFGKELAGGIRIIAQDVPGSMLSVKIEDGKATVQ